MRLLKFKKQALAIENQIITRISLEKWNFTRD